jgi:hypothetical protein
MPIRLFRKEVGQLVASRLRSRIETSGGPVGKLKSKLVYHTCWHVADFIRSMNQNTSRVAKIRFDQGQQPRVLIALLRAGRRFAKNFLWKHGYLDGLVGLQISLLSAFAVIVTEAKLWELRHARARRRNSGNDLASQVTLFRNSSQTIAGEPTELIANTYPDLLIQPDSCFESQTNRAAS